MARTWFRSRRSAVRSGTTVGVIALLSISGLGRFAPTSVPLGNLLVTVAGFPEGQVDGGTVQITQTDGQTQPVSLTLPAPAVQTLSLSLPLSAGTYVIVYTPPACYRVEYPTFPWVEIEIANGQTTALTFLVVLLDTPACRPVASLKFDSDAFIVGVGGGYEIHIQTYDEAGRRVYSREVSSSQSSDPGVVDVVSLTNDVFPATDVLITGVSPGSATITATIEGQSETATVTVTDGLQIQWTELVSGTTQDLNDVWGASSADVFAVGNGGTVLRYDGAMWNLQSTPTLADLHGVWGTGPNDVFAVGGGGTILHYDGTGWQQQESATAARLNAIWGRFSSDVLAVGENNTILHFNGVDWSPLSLTGNRDFQQVGGRESRVLVAGVAAPAIVGDPHPTTVLRGEQNGMAWTWNLISPEFPDTLHASWGASSEFFYLVGNDGRRVMSQDGGAVWTTLGTGPFSLRDVTGFSASTLLAVGGRDATLGTASGLLAQYDGSTWSLQFTDVGGVTAMLNGVWAISLDGGFAVGDGGTILQIGEPSSSEDRILAVHTPPNDLTVALVDGEHNDGTCLVDAVYEFEDVAALGQLGAPCPDGEGEAAVFAVDKAMGLRTVEWTAGPELVDETGLPVPYEVPIETWVAVDPASHNKPSIDVVIGDAKTDLATANLALRESRAGIQLMELTATGPHQLQPLTFSGLDVHDPECDSYDFSAMFDAVNPDDPEPDLTRKVLHVVYVDELKLLTSGTALFGYACAPSLNRNAALLFVSYSDGKSATLGHEIGHTMGLRFPFGGHVADIPDWILGFSAENVMARFSSMEIRDHFTLGQVYRMSADPMAWLNHAVTDPTDPNSDLVRDASEVRECQCDPYIKTPCPRLNQEVPSSDKGDKQPLEPWVCADWVRLENASLTQKVAGLIRGRLTRSGSCTTDLAGERYGESWGTVDLLFPNLRVSGECDSRVVLFYDDHGTQVINPDPVNPWKFYDRNMLQIEVVSGEVCGTDWPCIEQPWGPIRGIPIHLYWKLPSLEARARADLDTVNQIFADRFAGIRFDLGQSGTEHSGDTMCNPTASNSVLTEINVYYVPAGDVAVGDHGGNSACGDAGYIVTITDAASSTVALAHHLGHVLGLPDVTISGEFGTMAAKDNIMWHEPAGVSAARHLTLGQIFRANYHTGSWMQSSASTHAPADLQAGLQLDCNSGTVCPRIEADAQR